jgi:uncharacterized integral membrane protein
VADRSGSGRNITTKQVLVGVLIVVVLILAIANAGKVTVDFVVGDLEMRLFLVIIGSALIGWLIGWFMGRNRDA